MGEQTIHLLFTFWISSFHANKDRDVSAAEEEVDYGALTDYLAKNDTFKGWENEFKAQNNDSCEMELYESGVLRFVY